MNIISWKPKPKVLVNDIDSVLDSFFQNDWSFEKRKSLEENWIPSVDISENAINFVKNRIKPNKALVDNPAAVVIPGIP